MHEIWRRGRLQCSERGADRRRIWRRKVKRKARTGGYDERKRRVHEER